MTEPSGATRPLSPVVQGPQPPGDPQQRSRSDRRWDRVRYAVLVGWLLLIIAIPVFGERTGSWSDVRHLVASGQVTQVQVSGELPAGALGFSTVEVRWRHGPIRYVAEVMQVRGSDEDAADAVSEDERSPVVVRTSPSRALAQLQPDVQITHDQRLFSGGNLFGWHVPNLLALPAAILFFIGLGVLVSGPEPWRATRWAWFWLLLPPVGSLVFLVLSGPTAPLPRPRTPSRRLTGGWAFLLCLPLAALLAPYRW